MNLLAISKGSSPSSPGSLGSHYCKTLLARPGLKSLQLNLKTRLMLLSLGEWSSHK